MDEAKTRQQIIDKRLALAGWKVSDPTQATSAFDIDLTGGKSKVSEPKGPYTGHQFVDYALLGHGKPTAFVEAKRTSKDAQRHFARVARRARALIAKLEWSREFQLGESLSRRAFSGAL